MSSTFDDLKLDERGLVPAVVQDADSGAVLMQAYMNREALDRTLATGDVHFWSRSRNAIWRKGETSGNLLKLRSILADCDRDCLLVRAEPTGPVCHTGQRHCFFEPPRPPELGDVLGRLVRIVRARDCQRPPESYTARLFEEGIPRIAQKVGEEATEVVIAATTKNAAGLVEESADLLYHLLVLWKASDVAPEAIAGALERRMK
jgi:phosphoribosyl-ATP pyrophosphohydrolase/phosphoribosyl-AMP cyclohydrolase